MGALRIHLFGNFRLYQDLSLREIRIIPNVQTLLTLLLLQRGRLSPRDRIVGLLWGESSEEKAHSCLSTSLWRLRKILEPPSVPSGTYLICTPSGEIGFNYKGDCWVDMIEFEKIVQHITRTPYISASASDIHQIEKAVLMYEGDLLDGRHDNWLITERERLHITYIEALHYLLNFYQDHKDYAKAIHWGQQILLVDSLREDVHRSLIRLYTENGQRALAVQQYQYCQKILKTELGIEPMPETQMAYDKILDSSHGKKLSKVEHTHIDESIEKLQQAMEYIYRAKQDLQEAIAHIHQ
jgi:DNA-binding SARP family transcriptional activator